VREKGARRLPALGKEPAAAGCGRARRDLAHVLVHNPLAERRGLVFRALLVPIASQEHSWLSSAKAGATRSAEH
jgi:hypothetical protein